MTRSERLAWVVLFSVVYGWTVLTDGQPFGRIILFVGGMIALEALVTLEHRFTDAWYRPCR